MASSLMVEISARSTGQIKLQGPWKSHNFRPILLLLACLLPLQLYYAHQTVREKLYSSFSLLILWLTCAQNIAWLQRSVTFLHIISSSMTCTIRIRSYN